MVFDVVVIDFYSGWCCAIYIQEYRGSTQESFHAQVRLKSTRVDSSIHSSATYQPTVPILFHAGVDQWEMRAIFFMTKYERRRKISSQCTTKNLLMLRKYCFISLWIFIITFAPNQFMAANLSFPILFSLCSRFYVCFSAYSEKKILISFSRDIVSSRMMRWKLLFEAEEARRRWEERNEMRNENQTNES